MRVDFNMISLECQEDKKEHSFCAYWELKALTLIAESIAFRS